MDYGRSCTAPQTYGYRAGVLSAPGSTDFFLSPENMELLSVEDLKQPIKREKLNG